MEDKYKEFVLSFFDRLGCDSVFDGVGYMIKRVPRAFGDLVGKEYEFKICFLEKEGYEFVSTTSSFGRAIKRFLDNAGKTTLLKIDFDVEPMKEIKKRLSLKNCVIDNMTKRYKNNYFSRFSFLTTFRYLNEKEQALNEVYVHDSEVINGDLTGYNIENGDLENINTDFLKDDFVIAKESLKNLISRKTQELRSVASLRLEEEVSRVREYYKKQLGEISNDLNAQLNKISELELDLRSEDDNYKKEDLKKRIERLRKGLLKMSGDDVKERVVKEEEFTLKDTQQKYSLNISNKVLNTTVIYYPIFSFNLFLKNEDSKRFIELSYDPLVKDFVDLKCEGCSCKIKNILLCSNGHTVCENCLTKCEECGRSYCSKCVSRSCSACGKTLCKNCLKVCRGCGKTACSTDMRKDCVSGEERCVLCLRPCSRCHGVSQEKFFGVGEDGSKVCSKCLGTQKRDEVLKGIFR
jgi:hypothetical protein